jgi:hypothetical protein
MLLLAPHLLIVRLLSHHTLKLVGSMIRAGTSYGRLEELRCGSPLRSQGQEQPGEQQRQEVAAEEDEGGG